MTDKVNETPYATEPLAKPSVPEELQTQPVLESQASKGSVTTQTVIKPGKNYKMPLMIVVVMFVFFIAVAGYFYFQNIQLEEEVKSLTGRVGLHDSELATANERADDFQLEHDELVGSVNIYLRSEGTKCGDDLMGCLNQMTRENEASASAELEEDGLEKLLGKEEATPSAGLE